MHGIVGLAALLAGREEHARQAFRDEIVTARAHGLPWDLLSEALLGLAAIAGARGDYHRSAALEAAAWQHNDRPLYPWEEPVFEQLDRRFIAPARERIGEEAWDSASRAGREMTAEAAIDFALEEPIATRSASAR